MSKSLKSVNDSIESLGAVNNPSKKLQILEKSKESGLLNEDEYQKEKFRIQGEIKEFEDRQQSQKHVAETSQEESKKSDKFLIYGILFIVILFGAVFCYAYFFKETPKTIEALHILNLQGKLNPDKGYVYDGAFSFIKYNGDWYTQLVSPKGTKDYNLAMRYSPRELENISITGNLDKNFFDSQTQYYSTFNPNAEALQYTVLATADFGTHMLKLFEKMPIAACDRNESGPCSSRPIVDCRKNDSLVFYIKDAEELKVRYDRNCIVVEGQGFDIVRGTYRVLYNFYGIMDQ